MNDVIVFQNILKSQISQAKDNFIAVAPTKKKKTQFRINTYSDNIAPLQPQQMPKANKINLATTLKQLTGIEHMSRIATTTTQDICTAAK